MFKMTRDDLFKSLLPLCCERDIWRENCRLTALRQFWSLGTTAVSGPCWLAVAQAFALPSSIPDL